MKAFWSYRFDSPEFKQHALHSTQDPSQQCLEGLALAPQERAIIVERLHTQHKLGVRAQTGDAEACLNAQIHIPHNARAGGNHQLVLLNALSILGRRTPGKLQGVGATHCAKGSIRVLFRG